MQVAQIGWCRPELWASFSPQARPPRALEGLSRNSPGNNVEQPLEQQQKMDCAPHQPGKACRLERYCFDSCRRSTLLSESLISCLKNDQKMPFWHLRTQRGRKYGAKPPFQAVLALSSTLKVPARQWRRAPEAIKNIASNFASGPLCPHRHAGVPEMPHAAF